MVLLLSCMHSIAKIATSSGKTSYTPAVYTHVCVRVYSFLCDPFEMLNQSRRWLNVLFTLHEEELILPFNCKKLKIDLQMANHFKSFEKPLT